MNEQCTNTKAPCTDLGEEGCYRGACLVYSRSGGLARWDDEGDEDKHTSFGIAGAACTYCRLCCILRRCLDARRALLVPSAVKDVAQEGAPLDAMLLKGWYSAGTSAVGETRASNSNGGTRTGQLD